MRRMLSVVAAFGGLSLTLGGTTALANACGGMYLPACPVYTAPAPVYVAPPPVYVAPPPTVVVECTHYVTEDCKTPVDVRPAAPYRVDPMVVTSSQPMDHLRRFSFKSSPHVNIMRVYGKREVAELGDAPAAFTGGCTPGSTQYCRSSDIEPPVARVGAVSGSMSAGQAPYIAPPAPAVAAQHRQPAAPAAPRQYGSMTQAAPAMQPRAAATQNQWNRVSGPTMIGNMPSTGVVCRQPNAPIPQGTHIASLPPVCVGPSMMPQNYGTSPGWAGAPVARRYGSYH